MDKNLSINISGFTVEMIHISGGTFLMGAADEDLYAPENERPKHKVTLSSFYISKFQIRKKMWDSIMNDNLFTVGKDDNPPAEGITWNMAKDFILKISEISGYSFRLPSESEWEFVARGGNVGNDYFLNKGTSTNALGISDICRNNLEWCQDNYEAYTDIPLVDPIVDNKEDSFKVLRGGGADSGPKSYRASFRTCDYPDCGYDLNGPVYCFRLALDDVDSHKRIIGSSEFSTKATAEELAFAQKDEFGVLYSMDGKKLLEGNPRMSEYKVKYGTEIICDSSWKDTAYFDDEDSFKISKIILPDTITHIGHEAFSGCMHLMSINLTKNVEYIGNYAFKDCPLNIEIPQKIAFVGINPFAGCRGVKCNLEASVYKIMDDTLYSFDMSHIISCCSSKPDFSIPLGVSVIDEGCFEANHSIGEIHLPEGIVEIRKNAFSNCQRLKALNFPKTLKYIIGNPFVNTLIASLSNSSSDYIVEDKMLFDRYKTKLISCFSKENSIRIQEGIKEIGNRCFAYNCNIKTIYFPLSLSVIGREAFLWCEHLSLHIFDKVEYIENNAFDQRPYGYKCVTNIVIYGSQLSYVSTFFCKKDASIKYTNL